MSGETIYSRAADIIRERGWWDGTALTAVNDRGGYTACFVQALHAARANNTELALAMRSAKVRLGHRPQEWQDAPERTVEDVLLVLKELHVEAGGS